MARDEREARLPKWAQDELAVLRSQLNSAREQVAAMQGDEPTGVVYDTRGALGVLKLPKGGVLTLTDDNGYRYDVDLRHERERNADGKRHGVLHIFGSTGGIIVKPWAANYVQIRPEDRW